MSRIDDVVSEEWRQFQLVNNKGGRASCQDNWQEFEIMRKSQFMAWTDELIESYYEDLMKACKEGRNLLFEKYAFMMRDTVPQEFEALKGVLPKISRERMERINETVDIHIKWAEEFQKTYPTYASKGRPIHMSEAMPGETSIETYLRGELCTYGERTMEFYAAYVKECEYIGKNLTNVTRENMARLYGYTSLEDAEQKMQKKGNQ